jgi:2-(3-amino-3-carboxypropyl)histidine synthase
MRVLFVDAVWDKEIVLGEDLIEHIRRVGARSIALFASVQFLKLDTVKKQLRELRVEVKTTKAKRAGSEVQILGCDVYPDSFENDVLDSDMILYVGDGMFHPKALLLAGRKDVVVWNPISERMSVVGKDEIEKQLNKIKANLKRYLMADTIGIVVTLKPGQQHLELAKKLKKKLEDSGKRVFIFMSDSLDFEHFGNYPFVEAWVNTACPRIGTDDILNLEKPLVNIREALEVIS